MKLVEHLACIIRVSNEIIIVCIILMLFQKSGEALASPAHPVATAMSTVTTTAGEPWRQHLAFKTAEERETRFSRRWDPHQLRHAADTPERPATMDNKSNGDAIGLRGSSAPT